MDCVVFNFGRLPGGDPAVFTRAESSVAATGRGAAAAQARRWLWRIALYYGGANGYEERDAVLAVAARRWTTGGYSVLCGSWSNRRNDPPMPIFLWKER